MSHLLGAVAEEDGAGAQGGSGALQQGVHLRGVRLPQPPAFVLHPPALPDATLCVGRPDRRQGFPTTRCSVAK